MGTLLFRSDEFNKERFIYQSNRIDSFVKHQVVGKGLDERTEKAYRIDLEHLYQWLDKHGKEGLREYDIEKYLDYLIKEKKLKYSTVTRKYRVFCYYMEYLADQEIIGKCRPIICPFLMRQKDEKINNGLSKAEIDSFFIALNKEYENLDNEFRRRVCLRDSVMMELLFYHGIEITELLRLKISDYNLNTGILLIQGKQNKEHSEYLFSRELRNKMEQWISNHEYFEKEAEYHNILFLSKIGKPLSMKMIILIFNKYRQLAGIEKEFTPKDLKCSMKRYAREMVIERCS